MKAKIIETGKIIKVKYIGFDNDGYDRYRDINTNKEYHEIELDFDIYTISKFLKILKEMMM